ncbi:glycosyltransferase [Actinosynnema mirum]|uniref:Glycosyl transferase group 1 n=1 Tax=Actinosynnema mirum (strain ATCC 29888 / DSM 43827 / JCM 3225 / NBRC 14064 / NCIMB 13271 / NRRL B-12336 / IMRU 3971 / 101) TaxID=446462 RepID=C6WE96_ACTMD|nr:glycosyltransferase [Actinosynnema mirum]ACU35839.1 glycosyl transferase group 1 [Actinosynnema mirum DSM 43827]
MKIALVSESANPLHAGSGGALRVHVAELAAALASAGHEVVVHTSGEAGREATRARGYEVVELSAAARRAADPSAHLGDFARALARRWQDDAPDVVHAHGWTSGLAALLGARRTETPVVQSFHTLADPGSDPQRANTERLVGKEAAAVIASSAAELAELARLGVPRRRISVVPSGVDRARFDPEGPVAPRWAPQRLVAVNDLAPERGTEDLLWALRSLPEAELVVLGGDARGIDRARARAAELGVANRVRLPGRVRREEVPALLRSADAVVHVPWAADFGLVALEAMACGVPVVATAVGGLADTVVDGVTGVLVPPRDRKALVGVLRSLLVDDARRDAYGIAGADRVRVRYPWERVAHEVAQVCARAAGVELEVGPEIVAEAT